MFKQMNFFLDNFDLQLMAPSAIELIEMENSSEDVLPLPPSAGNTASPPSGCILVCCWDAILCPLEFICGAGIW